MSIEPEREQELQKLAHVKQLLTAIVQDYVTGMDDAEDHDVLINTSDEDRIKDFVAYLKVMTNEE